MAPKPSNVPSSPRIARYGTAFLSDSPVDTAALKRGMVPDGPQFSSPRLDASFLANCGSFLTGKTATLDDPSAYFKRIAGTDFRLAKSTVFYECSTDLCDFLAALTEQHAADIANKWYGLYAPAKAKLEEPDGRAQRGLAILNNLASLARQVKVGHTVLVLRVESRKMS